MFEELMNNVRLCEVEFGYQLCHCTDPYRLKQILLQHATRMATFHVEAMDLVQELEELDDAI